MPAPFAMVSSANGVTKIKDLLYAGHLKTLQSCFRQEALIGRLAVKHKGKGLTILHILEFYFLRLQSFDLTFGWVKQREVGQFFNF